MIAVCVLLFIMTLMAWIYIGVTQRSGTSWADITNAGAFAFWHDLQTLRWNILFQYGACALVQLIKVVDYWKYFNSADNATVSENQTQNENEVNSKRSSKANFALAGCIIAFAAFVFIVTEMCLL